MSRKKENEALDYVLDMLETVVSAVLFMVLVFTFVMRSAIVSGESMEDTLSDGDVLLMRNFFYTPKKGDIIVVKSNVLGKLIVKRVIAVSGEKVVIDYVNDKVYVCKKDKEPEESDVIDESYIKEQDIIDPEAYFSEEHFDKEKNRYEYTVPVGYVFVLGDNRNDSTDSRAIGLIDINDVDGKAFFRLSSPKGHKIIGFLERQV